MRKNIEISEDKINEFLEQLYDILKADMLLKNF